MVFVLLPLLLAAVPLAAAQVAPLAPGVRGRVHDQMDVPIRGASVAVTGVLGSDGVTVRTDSAGTYRLELRPGRYTLVAVADGFQAINQGIEIPVGSPITVDFMLLVAPTREVITVTEQAGYQVPVTSTATKTPTPVLDIPQSITMVNRDLMKDQLMMSLADVVRYVPGITMTQGEGHRDAPVIRGNATTADFYVNGVRDDVQYFRDLYNLERVEAVKGPNALIFGRGGGGGVINRVTKEARSVPFREVSLLGGTFGAKRVTGDLNQPLTSKVAARLNAVYENSNSFRNYMNLERYGVAPAVNWSLTDRTRVRFAYEYFHDGRVVDRGVPSYQGRPADLHPSTFVGNPDVSRARADVHLGSAMIEHQRGSFNIRNSTLFGGYDKFYGNVFAGAVNAPKTLISISGYDNATQRDNAFNQTDATWAKSTGSVKHTLLVGAEAGRQSTYNFRNTAYFNNAVTSINVPYGNPTDFTPVTFRQSASDANNRPLNYVAATYLQDQVQVNRYLQLMGGLRFDHFDLRVNNYRNGDSRRRIDNMLSPRAGLVVKPVTPMSVYLSYSVSYLPSSGDQFASLDATSETLKPEKFTNYEAGFKWDATRNLSLTTAMYRLDRTNTRAPDPNNPALIVQTGSQRTNGFEAGVNGTIWRSWSVAGGYAFQDAFITSTTAAARQGAKVAQVPAHTFSLWNNYRILPRLSAGLGLIHQADMYAGIDNTVTVPSFTRADAAVYYTLTEHMRLQANVENLTGNRYYVFAHSNNNISPGYARALRIGLTATF